MCTEYKMSPVLTFTYFITSNIILKYYIYEYRVQNESRFRVHLLQDIVTTPIVEDPQGSL